ncbi:MAG: hypothetical protein RR128_08740 [Clostridium sp.]
MNKELKNYIKYKAKVLHQLGINVGTEVFAKASNEIQVDHIARNILFS